jgi:Tol biopolymer transport system component
MKKIVCGSFVLSFLFFALSCNISPPRTQISSQPLSSVPASLTPIPLVSTTPAPDNSEKIAFMSNRSGFWDIYTMNTDGTGQLKLTNDDMKGPFAFAVAPDSRKIAYISDKSGNPDLWVIDLESKETVQLTNTALVDEGSPSWSADSLNIAFHSNANTDDLYQVLQVPYPRVINQPAPKIILSDETMNILHPAYSPNGSSILYSLTDQNGISVLHIYNFLTKKDSVLTKAEDQAVNGSWSPDSNKIIYWTNSNGIFQINQDGTGKSPLSTIKNIKGTPFFSPDGQKIVIARGFGFAEDFDVWTLGSDGREPKKLTTLGGLSLGWFKRDNLNNTPVNSFPSANPFPSASERPYLDPGDPLINP